MNEITIATEDASYVSKTLHFSGGELQISFPSIEPATLTNRDIVVTARLQGSSDLIRLILAKEIIDRLHSGGRRTLVVPYFPYARQDRVMQAKEAFSLKPVAGLINALFFDRVIVCDPHSDVTPALVERVDVIEQADLVVQTRALRLPGSSLTIIAPDAGAAKKAQKLALRCHLPLVVAFKVRDVATGEISQTQVGDPAAIAGRDALIVDDICDGGRTFIELAKALRAAGARSVRLYVTHGIFSQGFGVFEGLIDEIYTTDSFLRPDGHDAGASMPVHVTPCIPEISYEF